MLDEGCDVTFRASNLAHISLCPIRIMPTYSQEYVLIIKFF